MIRIDAQHGFLPPAQDAAWLHTILTRNRFEGSVLLAEDRADGLTDALAIAEAHLYIRAVIARNRVDHPLVRSVYLEHPDAAVIGDIEGLALEMPARFADLAPLHRGPVALIGLPPADAAIPPNAVVKLTGLALPLDPEAPAQVRALLAAIGPERLLFASGWPEEGVPWKTRLAAFTQALGAQPIDLREQILGGTARRFYNIA